MKMKRMRTDGDHVPCFYLFVDLCRSRAHGFCRGHYSVLGKSLVVCRNICRGHGRGPVHVHGHGRGSYRDHDHGLGLGLGLDRDSGLARGLVHALYHVHVPDRAPDRALVDLDRHHDHDLENDRVHFDDDYCCCCCHWASESETAI